MKKQSDKKPLPTLRTDAAADRFVNEADLSKYDLGEMVPMQFEFEEKSTRINIRMPESLMEAVKDLAEEQQMTYSRYIRLLIEAKVAEKRGTGPNLSNSAPVSKKKTKAK